MDEIQKLSGVPISPFIMSPGPPGLSPKRANGATVFFPTTITANGDAKLTTLVNGVTLGQMHGDHHGSVAMSNGQGGGPQHVKMECNGHNACCIREDATA